jgi:ribosomal protein S18 acetylase RimI-like enzyme
MAMSMQLRMMDTDDIPDGMRLKEFAGWNQTPADWERFLLASPLGCFVAEWEGRVVGSVTTVVYEDRFAWIGMLLVDPAYRGRGLGTQLLEKAIEYLDSIGVPTLKLDATSQGRAIYEKLGFVAEYEIERWILQREPASLTSLPPTTLPDFDKIVALDREVFGADRTELLRSIHLDAPDFTLAVKLHGELAGYALGRGGTRADHLGPWVAWDEPTAWELLDEFLHRSARETIFVDVLKNNSVAVGLLQSRDFKLSRPLTRMYRGPNAHPGDPELVCAILGPEFG